MNKKVLSAAGLLAAGLVAGSAFSINAAANAADENANPVALTNSVATDPTSPSTTDLNAPSFGTFGESDDDGDGPDSESPVTGDALQTLTDAALAQYPGATIIRVENDSDDATYEVHLKTADGGVVTVKFDANFAVTGTHNGFANGTDGGPSWNHEGKALGQGHGHDGDNDDQGEDLDD